MCQRSQTLFGASGGGSSSCDTAERSGSGRSGRGGWLGSDVGIFLEVGGGRGRVETALQVWCVVSVNTGRSQNLGCFVVVTSNTFCFVSDFSGIFKENVN